MYIYIYIYKERERALARDISMGERRSLLKSSGRVGLSTSRDTEVSPGHSLGTVANHRRRRQAIPRVRTAFVGRLHDVITVGMNCDLPVAVTLMFLTPHHLSDRF
jgi:hypothetical protein